MRISLPLAHELSVFAVALWGFAAILLTNEFNPAIIGGCFVLGVAAFWLRRRRITISRWITSGIAVLVFIGTGILAFQNLLDATIYLFMFLQIIKLASSSSAVEMRWCYLISLFHIIGASVLTTAMSFGLVSVSYILLLMISLRLYTLMKEENQTRVDLRSAKPTRKDSKPAVPFPFPAGLLVSEHRVIRGLIWTSGLLTLAVVFMALITFGIVPRLATQNLFQSYGKRPDKEQISAFDEAVEFGSMEKIQLDNAVALFAQPAQKERPDHVRLRGVALDTFDGRLWTRTTSGDQNKLGKHEYRPFTTRVYPTQYSYHIIQPPGITKFLFGDTFPTEVDVPEGINYQVDNLSNSIWLSEMQPKEFKYITTSEVEHLEDRTDPALQLKSDRPSAIFRSHEDANWGLGKASVMENLRNRPEIQRFSRSRRFGDDEMDSMAVTLSRRSRRHLKAHVDYVERCTVLPDSLDQERLQALAALWAGDAATTFAKAMAIETRFRRDFKYSLQPKSRGNFIEDFLFRTREGHCEYFATSMAVLLRSVGIPARIVNGFYSVEWNEIGRNFTVRQRDAHSWVEVYMGDQYHWMTFDPTPPAGVGRELTQNIFSRTMSRLGDAMRVQWYRYVIDYSISDQISVVRSVLRFRDRILKASVYLSVPSGEIVTWFGESNDHEIRYGWLLTPLILAMAMAVVWGASRFWMSRFRNGRASRGPEIMVIYYAELLRILRRQGQRLKHGQTPREFAAQLQSIDAHLAPIVPITEYYYSSRFAARALSAEQVEEILNFKNFLRKRKQNGRR